MAHASFHILVVCTGNICRSPMAERLLRLRLAERLGEGAAQQFDVTSAGVRGLDGWPMDRDAAAELRRLGGDPEHFIARTLSERHIRLADLVLTATRRHRSGVLAESPEALRRTFTLLEFADLAPYQPLSYETHALDGYASLVAEAARRRGSATLEEYDVADPYTGSVQLHREVADVIDGAVDRIVDGLAEAGVR